MKLFCKALPLIVFSAVALCSAKTDSSLIYFSEDYDKTAVTYPGKPVSADKIQNPKSNYLSNSYCTDIGSNGKFKKDAFKVTKLKYYTRRDPSVQCSACASYIQCYYDVQYQVSCGNGLTYNGDFQWALRTTGTKTNKWKEVSLSDYDASTGKFLKKKGCGKLNRVPTEEIYSMWDGRKVSFPEKKNGNKKLKRPIVFVPGHNASFTSFGAKPVGKTDPKNKDFLNGKVSGYDDGSLPDVIARDQNLDISSKKINQNGLYFFTAPYENKNGKLVQALPHWKNNQRDHSISFALYKYLEDILEKHYGKDWWKNDQNQVDLVAHSQGGLIIREMLRGLRANSKSYPTGKKNAANHIRRVVTVNTPHFGSELADDYKNIKKSYPAVASFIKEVEEQKQAEKKAIF